MKVLIVDDMEYARNILKELLEREQMEVEEANNGRQALDKIKKYKFDVVLLDFMLDDMNGIDLLKNIKSIDDNIRAIITSGYSDSSKIEKSISNGAEHYFVKPLDIKRLVSTINNF